MKSLIIVRHAKSSWDLSVPNDFDRTLNERGKKDAPAAAKRLLKRGVQIDAFISSPAVRAKKTAKYFIKEFGKDNSEIRAGDNLALIESTMNSESVSFLRGLILKLKPIPLAANRHFEF